MDITQLDAIAGECLAGGTFTLPPERFDDSAIRALFRAFFPTGVRLRGASRVEDGPNGAVRVTGRTIEPVLSLSDVTASVEMGIDGDVPYLSLRLAALPFGWTPAHCFADLEGSLVDAFTWESPALTLDSRKPHALPGDFEEQLGHAPADAALAESLKRGLSLEATLRPGAELLRMGWLIGTPRVRGGVEPAADGAPRMWLRRDAPGEPITLGPLTIPFGFELLSVLVDSGAGAIPLVSARFVSDLSFDTGSGTVMLPLAAAFSTPQPGSVALTGQPAEASAVLLSALPSLLGEIPIDELVPDDGPGFDALVLDRVEFRVATTTPHLLASSARVALAQPWSMDVGGLQLTVDKLAAEFTAVTPPRARASFSAAVMGTVALGGTDAAMDGWVRLPGLDFHCGLAEGASVDLTALLSSLLPDLAGLPRLVCTALEVGGSPRTGRYEISARLAPGADPWTLDVGITQLTVSDVYVAVSREPGGKPAITGLAGGRVEIAGAEMSVDWALPGGVELRGALPPLSMKELAEALCGSFVDLPPGFPDLVLEDSLVTLSAGEGTYNFALATDVRVDGMELGTVLFEVRKTQGVTGFMAGFLVPARWSPADLWSELEEVFGWLTLKNPGLIVSSVDTAVPTANLQGMSAIPSAIVPGVTFFATVELEGVLAPVKTVLGAVGGLNLAVVVAKDIKQTRLIASTGAPANTGSVAFKGFSLILAPAALSIEVRSGTTITVDGDVLDFSLAGILTVTTGSFTAALSLKAIAKPGATPGSPEAGWSDPFGLKGLTIYGLGGAMSVEAEGWSVAVEGSFSVGAGSAADRLAFSFAMQITNGELPSAAVASLRSTVADGVTLTRMVRGFTTLDLRKYSVQTPSVPAGTPGEVAKLIPAQVSPADVLDQLKLRNLNGFLVLDPTGFRSPVDPTFIYRGIGFHADGTLFGLGILADYDFQYTSGVYARGALDKPIDLFGVVKLSDAEGTGGARFVVDTKQIVLGGDLLVMTGALVVFGAKARLDARMRRDRLEFDFEVTGVPGIRACALRCSLLVPKSFDVSGKAEVVLEGEVELKAAGVDLGTLKLTGTAARVEIAAGADAKRVRFEAKVRVKVASDVPEIGFAVKLNESFTDLAQLAEAVLKELQKQGWQLVKTALGGVENLYRLAGAGVADLAADTATVLRAGYGMTAGQAAQAMNALGRGANQAARELGKAYGIAAGAVGTALHKGQYPIGQVEGALKSVYKLDTTRVLPLMRESGYAAAEVAGYYKWSESVAANMFRVAGYPANEAASALTSVYGKTAGQAGKLLKAAHYPSGEIAGVMKDVYGWSAKKTSKYMKDTLDYGEKTVKNALSSANYKAKDIEDALDDLWGDFTSGVKKIIPGL
ncbi:MAG TPA: hypothetical protein VFS20_03540 [Longimicrobium sp.]|nr:hypothetical protein [Longimicrobium sp.]